MQTQILKECHLSQRFHSSPAREVKIATHLPARGPFLVDPFALHQTPKGSAADAEEFGGFGAVAARALKHRTENIAIEFLRGTNGAEGNDHLRKVFDPEFAVRSEDDGMIDSVSELAQIAGPRAVEQRLLELLRELRSRSIILVPRVYHEKVRQRKHAIQSVPQRRHIDTANRYCIVKVFSNFAMCHLRLWIELRGGDHADICFRRFFRTERRDDLFFLSPLLF